MKFLALFFLMSCAGSKMLVNEPQVKSKGESFTALNQKVEVDILVEETAASHPESSVTKGALKPGSIVPQHIHEDSDEYLIFLKGRGELTIEDETFHVKDGEVVFIPKGKQHSYVNRSRSDAVFYQIYSPAGPEQRFKKWSKKGP